MGNGCWKLLNSEIVWQTSRTSDIAFTHSCYWFNLNYEPLFESPRLTFKQQRPHKSWKEQADAAIARKYRQLLRKPPAKQQRPHESWIMGKNSCKRTSHAKGTTRICWICWIFVLFTNQTHDQCQESWKICKLKANANGTLTQTALENLAWSE